MSAGTPGTRTGPAPGRSRRIVQVSPNYPPLLGGLERVVQILATRQAAHHDVTVVTTDGGAKGAPRRAVEDGVLVRRHRALTVAHTSLAPGIFSSLLRLRRGTVIHLHCAQAVIPEQVWLSARLRGLKYIVHFHMEVDASGPLGKLLPFYKKHLFGRVLRGAVGVIVLTESQREFLAQAYGVDSARIWVVPNGVSEEFFLPPREPESGPLRLLYVGRFGAQKNVARLIDAMAMVTEQVTLKLVGDGELRRELEEQVERAGLARRVEFAGRRQGPDLVKAYADAQVFVLPSDREGMPLVVMEAMAAGLPVLATAVPGNIETVGGVGVLAEPTPRALAAAIDALARDRGTHAVLAAAGAAAVAASGWDVVLHTVDDIYERVGF